jgi:hypothetical protein
MSGKLDLLRALTIAADYVINQCISI